MDGGAVLRRDSNLGEVFGFSRVCQMALYDRFLFSNKDVLTILATSFLHCITMSSVDPERDVREWVVVSFPGRHEPGDEQMVVLYENVTVLLCKLAVLLRPVMKMSRVGVGLKLFIVAFLSYFDFVTDILVSRNLYENGEEDGRRSR